MLGFSEKLILEKNISISKKVHTNRFEYFWCLYLKSNFINVKINVDFCIKVERSLKKYIFFGLIVISLFLKPHRW